MTSLFFILRFMKKEITFIDLFAGIGGIRLGLERALKNAGYKTRCVFTSEIKESALSILKQNHPKEEICGDITAVDEKDIPDFDIFFAGFPCHGFSDGVFENDWALLTPAEHCSLKSNGY